MKKVICCISTLAVFLVNAQKKDSLKERNIDEVQINGKYYKKYLKDQGSSSLRLDEELIKIPQNISIITNKALEDQQVTSISDGVIRNVAGAQRLENWGDLYTRINMRGYRAGSFLNGVNTTSNWGPLSEDMSYVDHIEFIKGPSGFLMSNGEPSGIYNVVTKKPTGNDFNGTARVTLGSFNLYRGETDFDSKISDKVSVRLNLMGQNKESFRKYEFNDRYVINPSVKVDLTDKTVLTTEYIFQKAKMSQVGSAYVFSKTGYATKPVEYTISDPGIEPTNVNDHTVNINLQHQFNENWKFTTQLTYINSYMLGSDIWPSSFNDDGTMIRNLVLWESSNVMKFGQVFVNGKFYTKTISHKILAGLDLGNKKYLADWAQSHSLDTSSNPFNINSTEYTLPSNKYGNFDITTPLSQRANPGGTILQNYSGLYLQDELGFFNDNLRLTIAARYTNVTQSSYGRDEQKANKITPRLGLSYSIDNNTSAYALYDQAFLPQAGFFRNGGTAKPLTGNNFEIGFKRDWMNGKWNTTLSLYSIVKKNGITTDPNNDTTNGEKFSIVLGKTRVQGVEFDLKGEITKGLNAILNYAFTENKVIESNTPEYKVGSRIPGYAKHTVNGWLNYIFTEGDLKGFGLSFGGTYLGDRSTWSWGAEGALEMNDYVKFDSGLSWENTKVRFNLNVFNLFDRYLYSGSYYAFGDYYYYQAEAPRNWRFSIAYKF